MNIELRSEILACSLIIEETINRLLLIELGIFDKPSPTRLFGDKGKINFQNKIDLLFDLEVLEKDENANLELLMNFRNKFMHIIKYDSFTSVINSLDNGIVNRFRKFAVDNHFSTENDYLNAFRNLYETNVETIKSKSEHKLKKVTEKHKSASLQIDVIVRLFEFVTQMFVELIEAADESDNLELKMHVRKYWNDFTQNGFRADMESLKSIYENDELWKKFLR
ncbi:hypothetical protein GVN16_09880 [Emticicia sp. CRIBPO]|uniref:hypothetical protein n=1 Tax=Emticicia sp. CRIBPO TaxID=2683258 RepID=UPI001411BECA|nr:hypothetical protein [Emticicia sp. CRIBPO]NBA86071.1 hypothetical protein [Emticicia sp. CRIBPO]